MRFGLKDIDRKSGTALVSAVVSFGLAVLKLILWALSSSVAIKADAFHSASDTMVSLFVFSGLRYSQAHGGKRLWVENLVSIVVAILILYAAGSIFIEATSPATSQLRDIPLALVGTFVAILISRTLGLYKIHVGKETGSPSILADGYHSLVDSYSSVAVAIGLIGAMIGLPLERLAATLVSLLVAGTGLEVLSSGLKALITGGDGKLTWSVELGERIRAAEKGERSGLGLTGLAVDAIVFVKRTWKKKSGSIIRLVLIAALVLYARSGLKVIGPDEAGIRLLFGKMKGEVLGPGMHFSVPYPFGKIIKVKPELVQRVEVGFRTKPAADAGSNADRLVWESRHRATGYVKYPDEAIMLTGDENLIDLTMVVQYHIADVEKFLFDVSDPELLVRSAAQAAVRQTVGGDEIDSLLTKKRMEVEKSVTARLQEDLDGCGAGIEVETVWLKEVHPPVEVVNSFREVASAREDRARIVNEAVAFKNEQIPKARGEAASKISDAEAYKVEKIATAEGDAASFTMRSKAARLAPEITRTRLYLETVEQVLPGIDKFIMKPGENSGVLDLRFLRESKSASKAPVKKSGSSTLSGKAGTSGGATKE